MVQLLQSIKLFGHIFKEGRELRGHQIACIMNADYINFM